MIKILLLLAGVWLIYSLLKKYSRSLEKDEAAPPAQIEEDMVRCVQCGVHLPRSEALLSRDEFFCCEEHRRLRHPD
ncbi:MAG: PP0621 family protein [Sulfurimicrobium sp.]|nr:PP0621 family protein [Sulfurimicrobium sp.]